MIIGTASTKLFEPFTFFRSGSDNVVEYENSMLPAGHILDLYRVQLANTAPFCENYTTLYFDAKNKIFGVLFSKSAFSHQ